MYRGPLPTCILSREDGHFGFSYEDFLDFIKARDNPPLPPLPSVTPTLIPAVTGPIHPIVNMEPSQNPEMAINDLVSMGRRQSDISPSDIDGQIRTLPNGNFQWEDVRRVCRHCNVETPNLNQHESHRRGKKHVKVRLTADQWG